MKQKVYLAGGMHSDWREQIKQLANVEFYDPAQHGLSKAAEYECWDLHWVKNSDICFAYMDKDNPSGFGLSVEIGYAKGLGKTVILVLETGHPKDKYLTFLKSVSDVVFDNIENGIAFLSRLVA